jgi:nucleotide-binding universal stress UspA family protein
MKKILIPTDFSSVADNALDYAIEIATEFESELFLYHVYTFNKKKDYDWDFPDNEQPYIKKLEKKMDFTKRKFMEKITQRGLSIQTVVEEDDTYALFNIKVKKHDIDLIVMGSKGASGLDKVVFGSVAAAALEMAKVPVLVVPPKHSFLPFSRVVLATDGNEVATGVLASLQKLASTFDAKVTIIKVSKEAGNKDTPHKIDAHLEGVETTYQEVPMSNSINESINEFVRNNKCDLLCMIRREKGFFASLFQTSITTNQVYDSEIPILVLPEK